MDAFSPIDIATPAAPCPLDWPSTDPAATAPLATAAAVAATLGRECAADDAPSLVRRVIEDAFPGEVALVSSFGAESAVLVHMVAAIDQDVPVIFLDTGKLFAETLRYRDRLIARLGLTDVRSVGPEPAHLRALDPAGMLFRDDADACCFVRKVEPLQRALRGFAAWISGRKARHGAVRAGLHPFEPDGARVKINPLWNWDKAALDAYFAANDLPPHPLEADGFRSIGCMPCTGRAAPGEAPRAGRWRGRDKTECGIHLPTDLTGVAG